MKCANTGFCGVYRGGYTLFLEPFVRYSSFLFKTDGVEFSDGKIFVADGFIRQPFRWHVLNLFAGRDENVEPFLSVPHDFVSAITDQNGEIVWSKDFPLPD